MLRRLILILCLGISLLGYSNNKVKQLSPTDEQLLELDSAMFKQARARENVLFLRELEANQTNRTEIIPDSLVINLTNYKMPTSRRRVTSKFGPRWGRMHKGLDIGIPIGDTIRAAFKGKVSEVKYESRGYGFYVVVKHDNGLTTIYAHLSKQLVSKYQIVKEGDPIGLSGNSGRSTGPHLHFEVRIFGIALDPEQFFDFPNQKIVKDSFTFVKSKYIHKACK